MSHFLVKMTLPALLLVPAVTSCSQNSSDTTATSTTTTPLLFGDANPARVLLAAVILASGDIEKAIIEGLVTSLDVDAAAAAIKNGNLDTWRERAETDFGK
jgi:hypothetical protein